MRDQEAAEFNAILQRLADARMAGIAHTHLVESCTSTQDVCRSLTKESTRGGEYGGVLVTALRQTAGRGRLGRTWADPAGESVALTLSLPARNPARLSLYAGLAVCAMAESLGVSDVGLRWPNDVMIGGRKLSGILVEVSDECAFLGIGINVLQSQWPQALQDRAISLAQAGVAISRPMVLEACMRSLANVLTWQDECASAAFARFDLLRGTHQRFRVGSREIGGVVLEISPLAELVVNAPEGIVHIPALTASLIHES